MAGSVSLFFISHPFTFRIAPYLFLFPFWKDETKKLYGWFCLALFNQPYHYIPHSPISLPFSLLKRRSTKTHMTRFVAFWSRTIPPPAIPICFIRWALQGIKRSPYGCFSLRSFGNSIRPYPYSFFAKNPPAPHKTAPGDSSWTVFKRGCPITQRGKRSRLLKFTIQPLNHPKARFSPSPGFCSYRWDAG